MKQYRINGDVADEVWVSGAAYSMITANENGIAIMRIKSNEGCIFVVLHGNCHPYDDVWTVGVSLSGSDCSMPAWPIRTVPFGRYSPRIEVDAPDDAEIDYFDFDTASWEDLPSVDSI